MIETLKAISDAFIVWLLRVGGRFGSELTDEGRAEQQLWREQRLRALRALSLTSAQRWGKKAP